MSVIDIDGDAINCITSQHKTLIPVNFDGLCNGYEGQRSESKFSETVIPESSLILRVKENGRRVRNEDKGEAGGSGGWGGKSLRK